MLRPWGRNSIGTLLMLCCVGLRGGGGVTIAQETFPQKSVTVAVADSPTLGPAETLPAPPTPPGGQADPPNNRDEDQSQPSDRGRLPSAAGDYWWRQQVRQSLGIGAATLPLTADQAVTMALQQAPEVRQIRLAPQIQRTEISRQQAAFDWNRFLETNWANRSEPIGNILTTGDLDGRFEDDWLTGAAGLRRYSSSGAQWELAQRSGWQRNNNNFLIPNPQSTSRLELTMTQPLMAGRGKEFTYARIVEAQWTTAAVSADSLARLQDYILDVAEAYWALYQSRAAFLIRQRAAGQAALLVQSLHARATLDTGTRQILRAETAAARQQAELMAIAALADRYEVALRRLLGQTDYQTELVTQHDILETPPSFQREAALQVAMAGRPEIAKAVREVRMAGLRLGISRNQLLPKLDLIAGSYVAGLASNRQLFPSFGNQFAEGRPSVNLGLVWEQPAGNRAARSQVRRRELELQDALSKYEAALQQTQADVQLGFNHLDVAFQTYRQRQRALAAAAEERVYLEERWRLTPLADGPAILLLESLIDAQARQADEEAAVAVAEAELSLAVVRLHRALGLLLRQSSESQPLEMLVEEELDELADPLSEEQRQ